MRTRFSHQLNCWMCHYVSARKFRSQFNLPNNRHELSETSYYASAVKHPHSIFDVIKSSSKSYALICFETKAAEVCSMFSSQFFFALRYAFRLSLKLFLIQSSHLIGLTQQYLQITKNICKLWKFHQTRFS